jgi:hypothetical protein
LSPAAAGLRVDRCPAAALPIRGQRAYSSVQPRTTKPCISTIC